MSFWKSDLLTTESLTSAVVASLSWLEPSGFEFFKSYSHYRRKNKNGFSYIGIDVSTRDRAAYQGAFFVGVQISDVEAWLLKVNGEARRVNHYDRTILIYTPNIGPSSPHWPFSIRGSWTLGSLKQYKALSTEVCRFVRELALPFVDEHQDPAAVRRTLMETPGHATTICPYRQILAIDRLYGSTGQLHADIDLLAKRYAKHDPKYRREFDQFVLTITKA